MDTSDVRFLVLAVDVDFSLGSLHERSLKSLSWFLDVGEVGRGSDMGENGVKVKVPLLLPLQRPLLPHPLQLLLVLVVEVEAGFLDEAEVMEAADDFSPHFGVGE